MCEVLHEVNYNAYASLHARGNNGDSNGGNNSPSGHGVRTCTLPLPARVRAAQQAKLQLRLARERAQPPLTYRELQQHIHALFFASSSSSLSPARLRSSFVRLLLRADAAARVLLQPLWQRWQAEEAVAATAANTTTTASAYDDDDEEGARASRCRRGHDTDDNDDSGDSGDSSGHRTPSWLLRLSVTSARVMAVLRCRQAVLCDGGETSYQDLLDRLRIAGALRETLTLADVRARAQQLGPHTSAAVESALGDFVREHAENNNSNNNNNDDSGSLLCDATALAAYLQRHVRAVLHASSSMTSHYYIAALDDLIDADEVAHADADGDDGGDDGSEHKRRSSGSGDVVVWSRVKVPAQRSMLCEWLFALCMCQTRVRLRMETYFLGMALFDRYLAQHPLRREQLLLYGCAALLLASKYEEIYLLPLRVLLDSAEHKFNAAQLMDAEQQIALALDFRVATATVSQVANALLVNQDPPACTRQREVLHYVLATLTVRTYYGHYRQTLLAATAVYLSRVLCGVRSGAPSAAVRALLPSVYAALQTNASSATVGRQLYDIFALKEHGQVSVAALSELAAARVHAVARA